MRGRGGDREIGGDGDGCLWFYDTPFFGACLWIMAWGLGVFYGWCTRWLDSCISCWEWDVCKDCLQGTIILYILYACKALLLGV